MLIERINLKGEKVSKDLDISLEQMNKWLTTTTTSKETFLNLSAEDLLFFDTGMTLDEYEQVLKSKKDTK